MIFLGVVNTKEDHLEEGGSRMEVKDDGLPSHEEFLIEYGDLEFGKKIGRGQYGHVYKGEYLVRQPSPPQISINPTSCFSTPLLLSPSSSIRRRCNRYCEQGTCVAIKQCVFEGEEQEMMQKYIAREISILKCELRPRSISLSHYFSRSYNKRIYFFLTNLLIHCISLLSQGGAPSQHRQLHRDQQAHGRFAAKQGQRNHLHRYRVGAPRQSPRTYHPDAPHRTTHTHRAHTNTHPHISME
jgi:hypothetical protein